MSTLPRKIRVVRAIKALLAAINGTGKFVNAVNPALIICGRAVFSKNERPAIGINEQRTEPKEKQLTRSSENTMTVYLDAFAVLEPDAPGEAALFLEADIKRALVPNGVRKLSDSDGEIASFTFGPSESLSSGQSTDIEGYSITLEIDITEKLGDPTA